VDGFKLAFLSPGRWQPDLGLAGSLFTEVRVARGPFSGAGSPLGEQPTAVDVGVAVEGRVGLFQAQGVAWLTGARSELTLHAAAEASFRGDALGPFVQARLDSRPGCRAAESPLCGVGGAVAAGLRGSFDAVSATPFVGVGKGGGQASLLVGVHTGLSFDVDFVRRHGDGSAAAQAGWQRHAASLRKWWGEQLAEREYGPLREQLERQRAAMQSLDERPGARLDELPRPEDALRLWRDAVVGEGAAMQELLDEPLAAPTLSELQQKLAERRTRWARRLRGPRRPPGPRDARGEPRLSLDEAGIAWESLVAGQQALLAELERERRQREEAQRVAYRPVVLPPMEKVALNAAVLWPFELLAPFYMGSPEGVEQVALIRRDLRSHLLPYTEEERELGEALEAAYQTMFAVGISLTGGASRAPILAARRDAVRTLQTELATVVTRAEPATPEGLLTRLGTRLNPLNYAVEGLGSNFGNVRFRPPRGVSTALPEAGGAAEAEGGHRHLAQPATRSGRAHGAAGQQWEEEVRRMSSGSEEVLPDGRQIDAVNASELIQAKDSQSATHSPHNFLSSRVRRQAKLTAQLAEQQQKRAVFWFKQEPHPEVRRYLEQRGISVRVGGGE
jgi:hypothetical protein